MENQISSDTESDFLTEESRDSSVAVEREYFNKYISPKDIPSISIKGLVFKK